MKRKLTTTETGAFQFTHNDDFTGVVSIVNKTHADYLFSIHMDDILLFFQAYQDFRIDAIVEKAVENIKNP